MKVLTHACAEQMQGPGGVLEAVACNGWVRHESWVHVQLAAARLEQDRLEAEARRVRDAAHEGHIAAIRSSLSGTKVHACSGTLVAWHYPLQWSRLLRWSSAR